MIDQLFGSKTRVKLLYLFFNNPSRPFYVREITRKIDEQINSVRRELANLLSIGIITSVSRNNRLYYEVNQAYSHFKSLSTIFKADIEANDSLPAAKPADNNQKRFRELGSIQAAYLLGSLVQDLSMPVDVFIVGDINRAKFQNLIKELEAEEGRELNYTTLTKQEYDYRVDINDRFLNDVLAAKKSAIIDELEQKI